MQITRKPLVVEATRPELEDAVYPAFGKYQRFNLSELVRALGDDDDVRDDLVIEIDDKAEPRPPEKVCPCVLFLVIAKTPSEDGGRDRSMYARGADAATRRAFYKKIADALETLRTAGAFDEACITTFVDLDMSGPRFAPYFPKNNAGQRMGYLDATKLDEITALIRGHTGMFSTKRCLTIVLGVGLSVPGGLGVGPAGRTPAEATPVAGSTPPVWTMKSDNISYLGDRVPAFKIAHELAHQGNLTHAADNQIHADEDGNPSGKSVPPHHRRPESDLLATAPARDSALRAADAALLRDYLRTNKCCDIEHPDGTSIR